MRYWVLIFTFWFLVNPARALEIEPKRPVPGAPILVKDLSPETEFVRFLGKEFGIFDLEGRRVALLAVPLETSPGIYRLVLAGKKSYTLQVRIYAKHYPEEHLKVPERMVRYPPEVLARVKREIKLIRETVRRYTPGPYLDGPFRWPLNGRVSSPFGLRRFFNGEPRSPHPGIDLAARVGTPVHAANRGRVVLAKDLYLPGKTVILDHGLGIYTIYAHLSRFKVKEGQMVERGQIIALSGVTGRATGPHLHFGCYIQGVKIDPQILLSLLGER